MTPTQRIAGSGIVAAMLLFSSCAPEDNTTGGRGCIDPLAVNYNASATENDGSCVIIPLKQNGMFFKFTATWCQPCGQWGMDAFNEVYQANKGKIVAFTVQTNDDLMNSRNQPTFEAFSTRWDYTGTPNFVVNNTLLNTNYYDAQSQINSITATTPTIGTGVHWTIGAGPNTGKINVNVYAKAFSALTGEYKMGVYIIAKKINAPQAGQSDPYEHHKVLLGFAGDDPWGETITTNGATADQVFHKGYVVPLESNWNPADIEVISIIWKKNGSNWDFVNGTAN
jgi:hypothetical protein